MIVGSNRISTPIGHIGFSTFISKTPCTVWILVGRFLLCEKLGIYIPPSPCKFLLCGKLGIYLPPPPCKFLLCGKHGIWPPLLSRSTIHFITALLLVQPINRFLLSSRFKLYVYLNFHCYHQPIVRCLILDTDLSSLFTNIRQLK